MSCSFRAKIRNKRSFILYKKKLKEKISSRIAVTLAPKILYKLTTPVIRENENKNVF